VDGLDRIEGGLFGFGYSNRFYDASNYDQTFCYNTGGNSRLLPACQMYFRCSTGLSGITFSPVGQPESPIDQWDSRWPVGAQIRVGGPIRYFK
jgi:hypothetical protein